MVLVILSSQVSMLREDPINTYLLPCDTTVITYFSNVISSHIRESLKESECCERLIRVKGKKSPHPFRASLCTIGWSKDHIQRFLIDQFLQRKFPALMRQSFELIGRACPG